MLYNVIYALHIVAVVAWFAALFYLPRLFVYHAENAQQKPCTDMLEVMERRLHKAIMNPAMMATWTLGLTLVYLNPYWLQNGWLHAKITLVVLLTVYHVTLGRFRKKFAAGSNTKSSKFFRMYNEVPTVLLITIVFLVVLKPF